MVRSGGGFYKRGCQVKTLFPGRRARGFLGISALCGEARTCAGRGLWTVGIRLRHNGGRLAKRRQALLESNPPRNSQRETHRKAVGRSGLGLAFAHGSSAFDRFPHASKNSHVVTGFVRTLWFGSDALQAAPGWQSANHGSI
jgi:hypothetical protein